jgi:hypothetical protein
MCRRGYEIRTGGRQEHEKFLIVRNNQAGQGFEIKTGALAWEQGPPKTHPFPGVFFDRGVGSSIQLPSQRQVGTTSTRS